MLDKIEIGEHEDSRNLCFWVMLLCELISIVLKRSLGLNTFSKNGF